MMCVVRRSATTVTNILHLFCYYSCHSIWAILKLFYRQGEAGRKGEMHDNRTDKTATGKKY